MPWEEGLVQLSPDVMTLCFCAVFQQWTWVHAGSDVDASAFTWSANLLALPVAGIATRDPKSSFLTCVLHSGDLAACWFNWTRTWKLRSLHFACLPPKLTFRQGRPWWLHLSYATSHALLTCQVLWTCVSKVAPTRTSQTCHALTANRGWKFHGAGAITSQGAPKFK